jgi:hypothetical protein
LETAFSFEFIISTTSDSKAIADEPRRWYIRSRLARIPSASTAESRTTGISCSSARSFRLSTVLVTFSASLGGSGCSGIFWR